MLHKLLFLLKLLEKYTTSTIIIILFSFSTISNILYSQEELNKSIIEKPYKINGVKEFHFFIKDFIKYSKKGSIEKLSPEQILDKTIDLSRVVIMVDNLSDENYFQVVYNAISSYKEYLFEDNNVELKNRKKAKEVMAYLDDLENDLVNQNKENMSDTGTKAFRFDIGDFKDDNSSNYDMKQEILKQGAKAANRYIPYLSRLDEETVNKFNAVGIDILKLDFIKELPKNIAVSLVKFKGKKIIFPSLKYIDNESLKVLSNWKNQIEFEKLEVTDKNVGILSEFKSSELRVKGLPKKYNKVIKKKMGKRYKRKIKFIKMKK